MGKKKSKNNKIINIFSNQSGMALLTTLIFVFVLVTLAVALLTMTSNDTKLSTLQRESTRAFYLAETGIEEAIWYMNSSEENPDGLDYMPTIDDPFEKDFGSGESYYVEFKYNEGPPEIKTLVSEGTVAGGGKYNKGTRKIEVKLKKEIAKAPDLFYDYAVLTDGDMTINGGVSFHGNIHSNIDLTNHGTINMEYGSATATGTTNDPDLCTDGQPYQDFPHVAWDYYERISNKQESIDGHIYNNYYPGDFDFDSSDTLYGVHFVDGNVTISSDELILHDATIFATGSIDIAPGKRDIILEKSENSNPLALVAKGYIYVGGNATITGNGIIQTEDLFWLRGTVNIEGAVYADDAIFGGGGKPGDEEEGSANFNVYYDTDLVSYPVPGTGVPVWVKISWQEVY
jgi:hypothetical protein